MTTHYAGVQYWTMQDTMRSLQMDTDELEALQYVRNITNRQVHCDRFDSRYHTHDRTNGEPAPDGGFSSLPMCMYGRCNSTNPDDECALNEWFLSDLFLTESSRQEQWYRNPASIEYGTDQIRLHHRVTSVEVDSVGKATGVHVESNGRKYLSCANHAVLLAAGVMGNAPLLLQLPNVSSYKFFAQPVVVYTDMEVVYRQILCADGSHSGGTFHWMGANGTGFLSTFGMCMTEEGEKRLLWATPQAINPVTEGHITRSENGHFYATVNFDDRRITDTLREDFERAIKSPPWNISLSIDDATFSIQYAGYHWSGDTSLTFKSRVNGFKSLYVADALGIVGVTSGWTSWNARVSGVLAAMRAMRYADDPCDGVKRQFMGKECCGEYHENGNVCHALYNEYSDSGCCSADELTFLGAQNAI